MAGILEGGQWDIAAGKSSGISDTILSRMRDQDGLRDGYKI